MFSLVLLSFAKDTVACPGNDGLRPIYIGKNQNPKNLGFLLYRLHCQKNP